MADQTHMTKRSNRKFFSSKIITGHLKTYMIVFLIPIVTSSLIFYYSSSMLREEIDNVNFALLRNAADTISVKTRLMDDIILMHQFNPNILQLLRHDAGTADDILRRKEIADTLVTSTAADSIIKNFFIYSVRQRYALGEGYASDYNIFVQYKLEASGIILEDAHFFLSSYHRKQFYFFTLPDQTLQPVYLSSVPMEASRPVLGTFVFIINQQVLQQELQRLNYCSDGVLYVLNPEYKLIAASNNNELIPRSRLTDPNAYSTPFDTFESSDKKYVILNYTDTQTGWHYVAAIPESSFYVKSNTIQNLSLFSLLLCLLIELILIYYFIRSNYKPISEILSLIQSKSSGHDMLDEYSVIHHSIQHALDDSQHLKEVHENDLASLRQYALRNLLYKKCNPGASLRFFLDQYGLNLASPVYFVVYISIDDEGELREIITHQQGSSEQSIVPFTVINVIKDSLASTHHYSIDDKDSVCVIVMTANDNAVSLDATFTAICDVLSEFFHMMLSVFISSPVYGIDQLHEAYNQCIELYKHYDLESTSKVFLCQSFQSSSYGDMIAMFPEKDRSGIFRDLISGQPSLAVKSICQILDRQRPHSSSSVRYIAYVIAELFYAAVRKIGYEAYDHDEFTHQLSNLISSETAEQLYKQVGETATIMQSYAEHSSESQNDDGDLIQGVVHLIKHNLSDNQLNVSYVANQLGVSQSNLSKIFKKRTGVGMLDYINLKRIDLARLQLRETDDTIYTIAESCGFTSVNTFIRTFKRYEGVSPKSYRFQNKC